MKSIETLVPDIYRGLTEGFPVDEYVVEQAATTAGVEMGESMLRQTTREERVREPYKLYASEIGKQCMRQVYFAVNGGALTKPPEQLQPHTRVKFMYGDSVESQALSLAELAGHKVERRQERVEVKIDGWTITGRIDAIIDDVLVDVKSASQYSFRKFDEKAGLIAANDTFGYREQLWVYQYALNVPKSGWLVVDKTLGHMKWVENKQGLSMADGVLKAKILIEVLDLTDWTAIPKPEPKTDGKNVELGTVCSYCPYKRTCYPDLRTFAYSTGPVHYIHVEKEPKVPEIKYED